MPPPIRASAKSAAPSSSIGSARPVDADPNSLSASRGFTGSNCRPPRTSELISPPAFSTSVPQDANCIYSETTSNVRPWLVANGLPLDTLEIRAAARGMSLDLQLVQMIQYCLENGVNGD